MRVLCRRTTPDDFGRNRWADISIHVLRVEDDLAAGSVVAHRVGFQSTSSVWRTTLFFFGLRLFFCNFNPRPPCGGRHWITQTFFFSFQFQSTSSVWRTTLKLFPASMSCADFNPRPPCGGRPSWQLVAPRKQRFQSTSSVWRTTLVLFLAAPQVLISIHVLRVEDDACAQTCEC